MVLCRGSLYFEPSVNGVRLRYLSTISIQSFAPSHALPLGEEHIVVPKLVAGGISACAHVALERS